MKKINYNILLATFILIILIVLLIKFCNHENGTGKIPPQVKPNTNLNISIFLDLSDRIDTTKYPLMPQQYVRDLSDIGAIVSAFKDKIKDKKQFDLKDKICIKFNPQPDNSSIAFLAKQLNVNFNDCNDDQRLQKYLQLDSIFNNASSQIYKMVLSNCGKPDNFPGSNIWRFFKEDINQCIENDSSYRNILFIITDGYVYHNDDLIINGNQFSYLEDGSPQLRDLRKNPNKLLGNYFENNKYGFIPVQDNLSNLEIYVLEVSTKPRHTSDWDILNKYWRVWFDDMCVNKNKYDIVKTALPVDVESRIKAFIK